MGDLQYRDFGITGIETIGIPESQLISNTRLFIQSNAWGRMAEIN